MDTVGSVVSAVGMLTVRLTAVETLLLLAASYALAVQLCVPLFALSKVQANVYGEVGAVLYDLGRQPRTAHDFLVKYQDRVLFGKDSYQPDEFPYYWRVFETADEYFDYYRDYHAFWKLYGLDLPDPVLRKLYYQNALKLVPGMPRAGFPN